MVIWSLQKISIIDWTAGTKFVILAKILKSVINLFKQQKSQLLVADMDKSYQIFLITNLNAFASLKY